MDIYDWMDQESDDKDSTRRCPGCGSTDVKYGIHDPDYEEGQVVIELSVQCSNCDRYDCGLNSGDDAKRMYEEWHMFEYAPGEEPPKPTHKPIGICECCGRTAYTKVDSVRVCWACAYHLAN